MIDTAATAAAGGNGVGKKKNGGKTPAAG